jgi:hypothetical protein
MVRSNRSNINIPYRRATLPDWAFEVLPPSRVRHMPRPNASPAGHLHRAGYNPGRRIALDIRQPSAIWPTVAADPCPMAALVIGAVDQEAAHASGAHLGEGDFLAGEGGVHAYIEALREGEGNRPRYWGRSPAGLLREKS